MICKRCKKPLPNNSITCQFCGMLMSKEQIEKQQKLREKDYKRIELLSEKYGNENKVEYNNKKENKILGLIIIVIILLILITLTILINVIK